jgi:hypothetical protein
MGGEFKDSEEKGAREGNENVKNCGRFKRLNENCS